MGKKIVNTMYHNVQQCLLAKGLIVPTFILHATVFCLTCNVGRTQIDAFIRKMTPQRLYNLTSGG